MEHYSFHDRLNWVDTTDVFILDTIEQFNKKPLIENEGNFSCIIKKNIVHTTKTENSYYSCIVYPLNAPSVLESAGIQEEFLDEDSFLLIHSIGIVRGSMYIDKKDEAIIRVFDHEGQSSGGVINKQKKVNIVIQDLQQGDILVYETTTVSPIDSEKVLSQKYFYYNYFFPRGIWSYYSLSFTILNERDSTLLIHYRNFNNFPGEEQKHLKIEKIPSHEKFTFYKEDYLLPDDSQKLIPLLNFATESDWDKIGVHIFSLYESPLSMKIDPIAILGIESESLPRDMQLQRAIEYVQNDIAYIYDADFMDGHIPQEYSKTLQNKKGDCKAKSLLLCGILKSLGLQADVILVNYNIDSTLDLALPSPFLFNHAIVRVVENGREYFIDPTSKNIAGTLPNRGEPVFEKYFPIRNGGGVLARREIQLRDTFSFEENIEIVAKTNTVRVTSTYRYNLADNYRNSFTYGERKKFVEKEMLYILNMMNIKYDEKNIAGNFIQSDVQKTRDSLTDNILTIESTFVLKNIYTSDKKEVIMCYPNDFSKLTYDTPDLPYWFNMNSFKRTILIKTSRKVVRKNQEVTTRNTNIDNEYFSFKNHKKFKRKEVLVETEFSVKKIGTIDTDGFKIIDKGIDYITESNDGIGMLFSQESVFDWWWIVLLIPALIRALEEVTK